jgi:hypothetical protein
MVCGADQPRRVRLCHRLKCRKHHRTLFVAAIFDGEAVGITGETREWKNRHFFPVCGSSVFGLWEEEVDLHLGALDEIDQFMRPTSCGRCGGRGGCRCLGCWDLWGSGGSVILLGVLAT